MNSTLPCASYQTLVKSSQGRFVSESTSLIIVLKDENNSSIFDKLSFKESAASFIEFASNSISSSIRSDDNEYFHSARPVGVIKPEPSSSVDSIIAKKLFMTSAKFNNTGALFPINSRRLFNFLLNEAAALPRC